MKMNNSAPRGSNKLCAIVIAASLMVSGCSGGEGSGTDTSADDGEPSAAELTAEAAEIVATFGADSRPVKIGWNGPNFDACPGYGVIKELDDEADNFLSVRSAPSDDAEEVDQLSTGTGLTMCESVGGWFGIVYEGSGAKGTDCGVSSPVAELREYDGPCRTGWISDRYVDLIAG